MSFELKQYQFSTSGAVYWDVARPRVATPACDTTAQVRSDMCVSSTVRLPTGLEAWFQAANHWKLGAGTPMSVSVSEISLNASQHESLAKLDDGDEVTLRFSALDSWEGLVLGKVMFRRQGNEVVVNDDVYDFDFPALPAISDPQFGELLIRNAITAVDAVLHGQGKKFTIRIEGVLPLECKLPRVDSAPKDMLTKPVTAP